MGNYIKAYGVKKHNLKNIDICIPKGKLTAITGVSGSGKSSLITHTLVPKLKMLIRNHVIQNEDEIFMTIQENLMMWRFMERNI